MGTIIGICIIVLVMAFTAICCLASFVDVDKLNEDIAKRYKEAEENDEEDKVD